MSKNEQEKKHHSHEEKEKRLTGRNITVGICACGSPTEPFDLLHALRKEGADIEVIMTPNSTELFSPIMVQRETSKPVLINQFELPKVFDKDHNKGKTDLLLVAPASANTVSKSALGLADNLLSTRILSATCPVAFILRCNPHMYEKASIQRNIASLKDDGMLFIQNEERPSMFPKIDYIIDEIIKIIEENDEKGDD